MTEVVWGNLAKAVDDKTKISEEIDADILTHNVDPSSHSQANESLYVHKIAAILDHLDQSITNPKLKYPTRAYNAIVASDGSGDYIDIQEAIEAVNTAEGGIILIRAGIYNLTDNIILYDKIELVGEGVEQTILNFTVADKNFRVIGTDRTPAYDSFSIAQGSKTLTAVNSDFESSVYEGDFVFLNGIFYEIVSVDSDTQLTLRYTYRFNAIVASPDLEITDLISNVKISNFSVRNVSGTSTTTGSGIVFNSVKNFEISNVSAADNDYNGIFIWGCESGWVNNCIGIDNGTCGFTIGSLRNVLLHNLYAISNVSYGFYLVGSISMSSVLTNCFAVHNGVYGFYSAASTNIVLVGCNGYRNQSDGIRIYQGDYNRVKGCTFYSNDGYGINISDAGARKNVIVDNVCLENVAGQINDSGTGTVSDNNVTAA